MTFNDFILWEQASRDTIDFKKCYVDVTATADKGNVEQRGDLIAGLLLSQIIFWFLPDKDGASKIRIIKDGRKWIAKSRHDWWQECRISPKQYDRAIKILEDRGLVTARLFKFNGNPTSHITINWNVFVEKLTQVIDMSLFTQRVKSIFPEGENPSSPKVKKDFDVSGKSITETTAESTNTTTDPSSSLKEIKDKGAPLNEQIRELRNLIAGTTFDSVSDRFLRQIAGKYPAEHIRQTITWAIAEYRGKAIKKSAAGLLTRLLEGMDKPQAATAAEEREQTHNETQKYIEECRRLRTEKEKRFEQEGEERRW